MIRNPTVAGALAGVVFGGLTMSAMERLLGSDPMDDGIPHLRNAYMSVLGGIAAGGITTQSLQTVRDAINRAAERVQQANGDVERALEGMRHRRTG